MKVKVTLYTIPQEACHSDKMNWAQAGEALRRHLDSKLGEQLVFQHTEFMSEQWFEDAAAQEAMAREGLNFPFVMVNGELASVGEKIHLSQVLRKARAAIA
jgi:hypothetical protein